LVGKAHAQTDCPVPCCCCLAAKPAIRITYLFGEQTNFTEKYQVKAKANSNYWIRLEADDGKGNITTIDSSKQTSDAKGQIEVTYMTNATTLQNGVEYTFTARLFDQMDTTDPKKALASDSQKYKFGDPEKKFPGLF